MTLARAWRRQLFGASSAALIVPSAMLAALLVLALGGGFGRLGVLGQIFAGPPPPSVGAGAPSRGDGGAVAPSLSAIPVAAVRAGSPQPRTKHAGSGSSRGGAGFVPAPSRGATRTGGAVGRAAPIAGGGGPAPVASRPAPAGPPSAQPPSPAPQPQPRPTPVDRMVGAVTPVAEQVPAPAGPAVTQAVKAAGSAADSVLPPGVGSGVPAERTTLP